ncbi:MAG: BMP family ABC transporter substrate-binding protein [Oscillospiraceae bacterium]|nr:BMP family ABC transporter substrate-binding protein [Oscillospiraceae bacterium]
MKKYLAIILALVMVFALAACGGGGGSGDVTKDNIKIGVVHIGPLADQGYTYNHHIGAEKMISNLGLRSDQYIPKFDAGVDPAKVTNSINELIQEGCHIIFATSFSHQNQMIEAARENPNVVFAHATGTNAIDAGLDNYHNYFAKIHEARYLGGIAAGLRTETNVLGYVAAHPFAEVISGFTAFYLGALSVNPDVTMEVIYIDSWGDPPLEQQVATRLIELGADVIAQHSDSATPAIAAQERGAWHVGYNNDMRSAAPDASMLSPRIDWSIYMTLAVDNLLNGKKTPVDWGEGLASGAAFITELNTSIVAPGTADAIEAAKAKIISGELKIFSGHLVDNDGNNAKITGYGDPAPLIYEFTGPDSHFAESAGPSAPSFNAIIKGINIIS